ncbi:MAG: caspase family protein [Bacteroidia bacterium]|nr:caspase family protein [Bacteroidia bacterium]
MKRVLISSLSFAVLFILSEINLISQQVINSGKSKIHINTQAVVKSLPPDIEIISPVDLKEGTTYQLDRQSITLALRVLNKTNGTKIYINNVEGVYSAAGDIVLKDLDLKNGINDVNLIIRENDKLVKEQIFNILYVPPVRNISLQAVNAGKNYALIIANANYSNPAISSLKRPINDAKALKEILVARYTFERENVMTLFDSKRENVILSLDELLKTLTPDDNLLIYYAGHGKLDEYSDMGYWLLSDANPNSRVNWLANSDITNYIKSFKSRHVLLVADACFAGSIFETRGVNEAPMAIQDLYKAKSRKAMTSGGTTEVSDDSKFSEYFLDFLKNNTIPQISSQEVYFRILKSVQNNSLTSPRWNTIQGVGDNNGDFVFFLREN